jgi:hypothetical protein
MELRDLLVGLIVLSTIVFTVGSILERSTADTHAPETRTQEPSHQEGEGSEGGGESGESSAASSVGSEEIQGGETLFGIDPESTPLVVVAFVSSLLLAAGCWLRPAWRWLLVITALAMAVFAALDVREVVHQFDESNPALEWTALSVALLHGAAAITAVILLRRRSPRGADLARA